MKLLFLQDQPCIRALKYAEGLRARHADVRLSFAYSGHTLSEFYGHGDECFERWFRLGDDPGATLREIVTRHDIDLIHSHNAPDTLTKLCIELFGGTIPIVHDIHDLMSARETAYEDGISRRHDALAWREDERHAIEGSDAVIAVSQEILGIARKQGYRLPDMAHVYPNYIPERFIPEMLPKPDPAPTARPPRVVYEGFLSSNGSHYDLRAIFCDLSAEGIEVHIYPSRENPDYRTLANDVPRIEYHSHLAPEKLFPEMTQYDFGWAGFNQSKNKQHLDTVLPNKLFEYIACGLPVISFPHKALGSFLESHRLGLVVDSTSVLAKRLRGPDIPRMRENVRTRRREFTVEANIDAIVDIYRCLWQAES